MSGFKVGDEIRHRTSGERAIVSHVNETCGNVYINGNRMDEIARTNWERVPKKGAPEPPPVETPLQPERAPITVTGNGHAPIPPTRRQRIKAKARELIPG